MDGEVNHRPKEGHHDETKTTCGEGAIDLRIDAKVSKRTIRHRLPRRNSMAGRREVWILQEQEREGTEGSIVDAVVEGNWSHVQVCLVPIATDSCRLRQLAFQLVQVADLVQDFKCLRIHFSCIIKLATSVSPATIGLK